MTKEEAIMYFKDMNECTYGNVEPIQMAIKALEQEPCDDVVSRQAVLDIVNNPLNIRLDEIIKKLPSVRPQEPKTGSWIKNAEEWDNTNPPYICSECGNAHLRKTDYCDQCGCRMVEPQEREDKE